MITLKSCPNCDSNRILQYRALADPKVIFEIIPGVKINAAGITIFRVCQDCHLIFQNPRLSDTELDKYYSTGYYRRTINPPPEGMDASETNRAKIDAEIIKQHVGKLTSHLDIGCGRGYLLDAVDAKVKVGVESNVRYVKVKGIKVYRKINLVPQKSFDLVTAIHVLEHVPKPLDYLKSMAKFVSKSGYLVIEVPSWKTHGGPLGFAHLSYFETDVLKLMCVQVGLKVLQVEFTPHLLLICKVDDN